MGRVIDRAVPPRGYSAASISGLLSCEIEGDQQQLPFGFGDLQVQPVGLFAAAVFESC